MNDYAIAGKAIRKELKAAFPNTKFRVTGQIYSGGDSVRISWVNGPTTAQVDEIVQKYQYGKFDGMADSYEYTNTRKDLCAQVKYLFTEREISEEVYISVLENHPHLKGCGFDLEQYHTNLQGRSVRGFIRNQLNNISL